jgi:hypothetical protein
MPVPLPSPDAARGGANGAVCHPTSRFHQQHIPFAARFAGRFELHKGRLHGKLNIWKILKCTIEP